MSPLGPGKYDPACTLARGITGGGVILIVMDGTVGNGFAAQLTAEQQTRIPAVLRIVADQIEATERVTTPAMPSTVSDVQP